MTRRVTAGSSRRVGLIGRATAALGVGAVLAVGLPASAGVVAAAGSSEPTYSLLTEPGSGIAPIYALVTGARHTVDLSMYSLADPTMEKDLAADAERGVRVRVLLDRNYERALNQGAYDYLSAHHVEVRWAPSSYDAMHQKTITIDDDCSVIMSLNLVRADYAETRDFAVVDRDQADVNAILTVFDHDFAGDSSSPEPAGADLVWSPGSDHALVALIGSATHSLEVENEEMSEYTIVDALEAAAQRGVDVELVMTYQSKWKSELDALAKAGVHVRTYADADGVLYIHAKAIVVDAGHTDERLFVGSENFSWASLEYNRELGLVLPSKEGSVISSVAATIHSDWLKGRTFS